MAHLDDTHGHNQASLALHVAQLGLTDYRSFQGTNLADAWPRLLAADPRRLADPLGNAAVVLTRDLHVLLLRRSTTVGEAPGMLVLPGGHPEPSATPCCKDGHPAVAGRAGGGEEAAAGEVAAELYESMLREVVEETGLRRGELSRLRMLGIARRRANHRPVMVFMVDCALCADAVIARYAQGADGAGGDAVTDRFEVREVEEGGLWPMCSSVCLSIVGGEPVFGDRWRALGNPQLSPVTVTATERGAAHG